MGRTSVSVFEDRKRRVAPKRRLRTVYEEKPKMTITQKLIYNKVKSTPEMASTHATSSKKKSYSARPANMDCNCSKSAEVVSWREYCRS
jgi:hypothetical protein